MLQEIEAWHIGDGYATGPARLWDEEMRLCAIANQTAHLRVMPRRVDALTAGRRDLQHLAFRRQAVVEVGDEVLAQRRVVGIVPAVDELVRIVLDVVQLALGAVVRDRAHRPDAAAEHAGGREELLEAVRFADGRRLVRGAQPAVAVDRPQVHAVAGELRVPLAQHTLATGAGGGRATARPSTQSGAGTPAIAQNVGARSS